MDKLKKKNNSITLFVAILLIFISFNLQIKINSSSINIPLSMMAGTIILIISGYKTKENTINGKRLFYSSIIALIIILLSFLSYFLLTSKNVIELKEAIPDKLMENVDEMNNLISLLIKGSTPLILYSILLLVAALPSKIICLTIVIDLIEEIFTDKNKIENTKKIAHKLFNNVAMVTISTILLIIFAFRFINNISFVLNTNNQVTFNINYGGYIYIILLFIAFLFFLIGSILLLINWIKYLINVYKLSKD